MALIVLMSMIWSIAGCSLLERSAIPPPLSRSSALFVTPERSGDEDDNVQVTALHSRAVLSVLQGTVEVRRGVSSMSFDESQSELLEVGDIIRTRQDSLARIVFFNETESLLPGTVELAIDDLAIRQPGQPEIRLRLISGRIFSSVNMPSDQSRYSVDTIYGGVTAFGGVFWVDLDVCEAGVGIALLNGEVAISDWGEGMAGKSFVLFDDMVCFDGNGHTSPLDYDTGCDFDSCIVQSGKSGSICSNNCTP